MASGDSLSTWRLAMMSASTSRLLTEAMRASRSKPSPLNSTQGSPACRRSTRTRWAAASSGRVMVLPTDSGWATKLRVRRMGFPSRIASGAALECGSDSR